MSPDAPTPPVSPAPDWPALRALFPATRDRAYLDTASYGPGPEPVRAAIEASLAEWSEGRGSWRAWEAEGEVAREGLAQLLGISASRVALMPAMSVAAGQVAEGSTWPEGANLVVGEQEFRSNMLPWDLQSQRGVEVRRVPFRDHGLDLDALAARVDDRTALVAVSAVQSATGYRAPLEDIGELCRRHGARLFVDGTQMVGALRMPMECIDYLALAAYKWLLAPRGTAFLVVREEHLEELRPIAANWKSPMEPYGDYYGPADELADTARRFDVSLAWTSWIGAGHAMRLLLDVGIEAIEARDLALAQRFREGLADIGLRPLFAPERCSQIISLDVPDPEGTAAALARENVVASVRHGCLRAGFHFYNDASDVDRALAALGSIA